MSQSLWCRVEGGQPVEGIATIRITMLVDDVASGMGNTLLVAYDGSPQSTAALNHALSIADGGTVHVLHVLDPREWSGADTVGVYYSEDIHKQTQDRGESLLEEAESIGEAYDATVETALETGSAAGMIVEYADEHGIDHIIMGSHGRRGLSRFLLGSVAERVVKRSPGSVTIIREADS